MSLDQNENNTQENVNPVKRELPEAAKRALAEAKARREQNKASQTQAQKEYGGRGGADPSRFGDWEIDGRAIDF